MWAGAVQVRLATFHDGMRSVLHRLASVLRARVGRGLLVVAVAVAALVSMLPIAGHPIAASSGPSWRLSLQRAFRDAAREFGVPEPVLLSVSYHLSLWEDHHGAPSTAGGYGPMHLTDVDRMLEVNARGETVVREVQHDPSLHTLDLAARLLHETPSVLKRDPVQNIRGGAAVLARYAVETSDGRPRGLGDWFGAVAKYSGSQDAALALEFADAVYRTIRTGARRVTTSGQEVVLKPQRVLPNVHTAWQLHLTQPSPTRADCPAQLACQFVPAAYQLDNPHNPRDYGNYDVAQRPGDGLAIRYIVIHDTETSYASTLETFQNPRDYASANYVIRASDGLVTQMVPNQDIAWHAGNYYVNIHAIGIEHEGVAIEGATWYTEQVYETSAALVRYLAHRYHIPLDRAHIVGHDNVPGMSPAAQRAQHWDPGPYWDWQRYMELLGAPIRPAQGVVPAGPSIVTIDPAFASNRPTVTSCLPDGGCRTLTSQPANFVYLRVAPDPHAPLLGDAALYGSVTAGTTEADDWGDKAVTGQEFVRVGHWRGWDAVDYGGRVVWLYDPPGHPTTVPAAGRVVTPKGSAPIDVYGCACPPASAYPRWVHHPHRIIPLPYTIPPGQEYVATGLVTADYYWAPTQKQHVVVKGRTAYYQIFFNHRFAFVLASQVRAKTLAVLTPTPTPTSTPSPTLTPSPTPAVTPSPTPSPTPAPTATPGPTLTATGDS